MHHQSVRAISCLSVAVCFVIAMMTGVATAQTLSYQAILSGAAESPPNSSTAVGTARVTFDASAQTMRVVSNFSGLTGTVTVVHIHCCTSTALTGTAGVATVSPTFPGFPTGVTSGSYDNTFDMTLASSYNSGFLTSSGGTTAAALTALQAGIAAGKSYFNLHTTTFGGGEIRGFLVPPTLDVDASNTSTRYHALTDGLLIMRYLLNPTGTPAVVGITGATATRILPADVKTYLDLTKPSLDIDGDSSFDASTDGMLILRYLLGLRGDALVNNAVTPGAPRNTALLIEAYLGTLTP